MSKEFIILAVSWILSIILLVFLSRGRSRLTLIAFLFTQALAWIFEYTLVYFDLVEFPYREFKKATNLSFSLYYIIFPIVGVLFIVFYPKNPKKVKVLFYYLLFSMVIPTFSSLAERYTDLFHFNNWNWFVHVFADLVVFYIIAKFVFWFKKG
ncbi:hypothetical protein FZW96_14520 [Bacillus sp. BGMRC 2118]|nr:hypothetical protein FZW96_14520 [Bacillus sp. BGMRC 2118]